MKKKVLLLAAVLMLSISSMAYAVDSAWLTAQTDGTWTLGATATLTGIKPSANVTLGYGSTVANGQGIAYAIGAYHGSGTFSYATTSTDTNIYRKPVTGTTFTAPPNAPATATAGVSWLGWTASK